MNSYKIIHTKELNNNQKREIWEIMVLADHEFIPKLSERNSTTQKELTTANNKLKDLPYSYYENLLKQSFLLAIIKDRVVGFMSYIPDHNIEIENNKTLKADYVSTVIIHPEFRSNGITESLYNYLMMESKTGIIATRTWSTNYAHLHILKKMGFENIHTIVNDRGNEIDTVYYLKTV